MINNEITNFDNELMPGFKLNEEKIKALQSGFFSALDDFKKYYVYYNKNPEVDEFLNFYTNSKGQLQNFSRDIYLASSSIDKTIEELDKEMGVNNQRIKAEKKLNEEMLSVMDNLQETKNGSVILIGDSKDDYNNQYYKNLFIIIGTAIVGGSLAYIFKKKDINVASVLPIER